MVETTLKRIAQIVLLTAAQVLVCNHVHLLGYATPMIYVLFLCYVPINANRIATMCWAFLLGLSIDILSATPGLACASLTLAAFIQRPLLESMAPKERTEDFTPSYRMLGAKRHFYFILVLTCVHHTAFVALEFMSYFNIVDMALSLCGDIVLSMIVMLTIETTRDRKKRSQAPGA